uniref:Methyltransferase-like protein n=1 Tax=Hanusia phi TaxID=3032 RepID=A0A7S0F6X8_9CRYP|mmetsp:Transcript_48/g.139  ORF Transcript_48/g.139 Transcript_48/m.139 type:complete len:122 (+) Transcript_48:190-555(+)
MDICLMIFVLSAISPEKMLSSLTNVAAIMRKGGKVLFRDYGLYDMAQLKMAEPKGHKIQDNFYVRKDGTRAYYFSEEMLEKLFKDAGFKAEKIEMHKRLVRNRKEGYNMHRRWIQAEFVRE